MLGKERTSLRDCKLITSNNEILKCNLEIIPQHNSSNQISGYLVILDIDEAKNSFFGNNLKEIQQIFDIIEDQEFVSIALLQDNVFKYVNKNFLKVTGYSRAEVREWGPGEFLKTIHPDYRDFVKEQAVKKQNGDEEAVFHYFFKGLKKSGQLYWAEVYSKIIEYEGRTADLVMTLEKTEQILVEKELKKSQQKYKALFETSPYYILIVDENWNIVDCNSSVKRYLGYTKEEMLAENLNALGLVDVNKLDKLNQRTNQLLGGKKIPPIELRVKKKNGDLIWVESQPALFKLGSDNFIQIYGKDITDIKLTEQKLKEKEISYQNLIHNLPAIVYRVIVDENKTIFLNNKFKEIIGYTVEELRKNKISSIDSLVIDEDKVDVIEVFENSRKKKESFELEYRIHDKEGDIKWLQERGNPILDSNENLQYVDGVIFDITERKLAEKKLKESEKRYRDLFQKSPIGFYEEDFSDVKDYVDTLKKKGVSDIVFYLEQNRDEVKKLLSLMKRINLNKAILDLFKASDVEDLSKNSSKIFTSKGFDTFIEQIDCLLKGKKFEGYSEARTITGELIVTYVIMERLTDDVDDWSRILFSIRDVTEQKQAEEMLKNSEEKFRTIAEQSIIGLNIMQGGKVKYANKAIADMYGYDYSAIKRWSERDFINIIHPQDKSSVLKTIKEQVKTNSNIIKFNCRIITSFGQIKWIEVTFKSIFYREKAATLNIVVDITDQKKAEKELTRLNQIKSDLLKRTSHELKTPLVSIKGFSNLLTEMYKDTLTDDIIKLIEEIKSGVSRLENLISDILKTAELESENVGFNKSYENLASIIRETVKELEGFVKDRNHEITIDLPEELNALVEKKNIKEVIGNLLTNAIKYTPPGGQINVKSQKSEENIKILIQDTGIGLTEEEQSQLFKQFGKIEKYGQGWDIHSEGTGLGLFISKKIIDLHGGSIGVKSEGMNKGCTFYFTIPLYSNFEGEVKH